MSNIGLIIFWLLVFGFVILLDLIILRIWRVYRQLRDAAAAQQGEPSRFRTLKEAISRVFSNLSNQIRARSFTRVFRSQPPAAIPRGTPKLAYWFRREILRWPLINLVLAALAIYAGQYLMVSIPKSRGWGLGVLIGGILLAYYRLKMTESHQSGWMDWFQVGLGFLICLPLALNIDNWTIEVLPRTQIALWFLSVMLVAAPALKLKPQKIGRSWPDTGPMTRSEWVLLAVLVIGSFLFRAVALESIPAPIDPDEASLGLFFVDVIEGRYKHPFGTGWATHPALQFFLITPLNYLIQQRISLMRFPSVLYGTLALIPLYFAARAGWGRRVALISSVLMMSSDVAIHFSRLGVNNVSDSLFASWTMAALWTAGSTGSPAAFVLTGAAMGLAQYYYFGNRAIPFVVFSTLILWGLSNRRQFQKAWVLLIYLLLVFLVVAGPLLGLWVREPQSLDRIVRVATFFTKKWENQADQNGQSILSLRLQQVRSSLLVFTVLPDQGSFYNSGRSMLPPILAPLFIIGFLVLIGGWKKLAGLSTIAWILVTLTLGSILINTAGTFQRLLGLYPAVLITTAVGLETTSVAIYRRLSLKGFTPGKMAYLVVVLASISSVYFYFNTFNTRRVWKPPDYYAGAIVAREYTRLNEDGTFILQTLLGVGEDGTIYLPLIKLIDQGNFHAGTSQLSASSDDRPYRFYFFYDKFDTLPDIQARYPGGKVKEYRRPADRELILIRYTVP
jgi:hypothetical protein